MRGFCIRCPTSAPLNMRSPGRSLTFRNVYARRHRDLGVLASFPEQDLIPVDRGKSPISGADPRPALHRRRVVQGLVGPPLTPPRASGQERRQQVLDLGECQHHLSGGLSAKIALERIILGHPPPLPESGKPDKASKVAIVRTVEPKADNERAELQSATMGRRPTARSGHRRHEETMTDAERLEALLDLAAPDRTATLKPCSVSWSPASPSGPVRGSSQRPRVRGLGGLGRSWATLGHLTLRGRSDAQTRYGSHPNSPIARRLLQDAGSSPHGRTRQSQQRAKTGPVLGPDSVH